MKRVLVPLAIICASTLCCVADDEAGFVSLMDGKTFAGWKMANENTNTWKIEDGAFVTRGGVNTRVGCVVLMPGRNRG